MDVTLLPTALARAGQQNKQGLTHLGGTTPLGGGGKHRKEEMSLSSCTLP